MIEGVWLNFIPVFSWSAGRRRRSQEESLLKESEYRLASSLPGKSHYSPFDHRSEQLVELLENLQPVAAIRFALLQMILPKIPRGTEADW